MVEKRLLLSVAVGGHKEDICIYLCATLTEAICLAAYCLRPRLGVIEKSRIWERAGRTLVYYVVVMPKRERLRAGLTAITVLMNLFEIIEYAGRLV